MNKFRLHSKLILLLFLSLPVYSGSQSIDTVRKQGKASFYHDKFQGRTTSNGEQYDKNDFTAAHRTLPFNSIVHVQNKKNGKSVIVRINDRGPFAKSRIIDLSKSAAEKIEMVPFGIVPVTIRVMTLLDKLAITDSTFKENEIWDCYGNKVNLSTPAVMIWITESWKHAFYTASKLALDNQMENIVVRISGSNENRAYEIIANSIKNDLQCDSIIKVMTNQGFKKAHKINAG